MKPVRGLLTWCDVSLQSYGVDHLLTFANLRQLGLLVEQQPGETLTVMESKVGKLVNDKTAGERGGVVLHLLQAHNLFWSSRHFLVQGSWATPSPLWQRRAISEPSAGNSTWSVPFRMFFTALRNAVWHLNCILTFNVKVPKSDEEYDLRVPRDMAYIFSGAYIPLSCKLIEQVGNPAGFQRARHSLSSLCYSDPHSAGVGARRLDGAGRSHQAAQWPRVCRKRWDHEENVNVPLEMYTNAVELQFMCTSHDAMCL